jgi:hypothetical protein
MLIMTRVARNPVATLMRTAIFTRTIIKDGTYESGHKDDKFQEAQEPSRLVGLGQFGDSRAYTRTIEDDTSQSRLYAARQ